MDNIYLYLLAINVIGFLSMGIDKFKAKNKLWRNKEKTLFVIAMIGGSIGSIIGMYTFRHKTKHNTFVYGMPIILGIQIGIAVYLALRG
jgi:uncharacterized membrane protein YsdA (DUF1294 family)